MSIGYYPLISLFGGGAAHNVQIWPAEILSNLVSSFQFPVGEHGQCV